MAIAEMGEDIESLGLDSLSLERRMREAQKSVDDVAATNQLNAVITQMHDQLSKTTDSRNIDEVKTQTQDKLNDVAKQWGKSPAVVQIQMKADSLHPTVDHFSTVKQTELMTKEWATQTEILKQSLLPQIVTAHRDGNVQEEQAILSHVASLYDDAIKKGLVDASDKDKGLNQFDIMFRMGVNDAAITSPNPAERKQAIAQLKSGGSGPLDLTNLSPGDINAMRAHAMETDKRLTELSGAQNLNSALNVMDSAFKAPEYKDNFEAQQKSLEDGKWLTQHGIVDENGQPDRVMAEKLTAEVERQRTQRKLEQNDRDDKVLSELSPLIDDGKISRPQLEQKIQGLSARAKAVAIKDWHQEQNRSREEWRMERSMTLAERQDRRQDEAEKSTAKWSQVRQEIAQGKIYEPMDIREMDGLTQKDRDDLSNTVKNGMDPNVRDALLQINDLPLMSTNKKYELDRIFVDTVKKNDLRGAAITQAADSLIQKAKESDVQDWIDQAFRGITTKRNQPSGDAAQDILNRLRGPVRPKGVPSNAELITDPDTGKKRWAW